jgi:hypothetical protein
MLYVFLIVVLLLAALFGVAFISQSASTAAQAQAAIEASRATQIVGANNLLLTVWVVVMTIVVLALVVVILYVVFRPNFRRPGQWQARPGQFQQQRGYDQIPAQQGGGSPLEAMATMLMLEMMEERRVRRQQHPARMMIEDDEWKTR